MSTLLDTVMPTYQFSEVHHTRVNSTPGAAITAMRSVSLADMPLARLLFRMRGMRTEGRRSLWDSMLAGGFVDLGQVPGRELAGGMIAQMWKVSGGQSPRIEDAAEFAAFDQPGYAKAAMSVLATQIDSRCQLVTETRVFATDEAARRAFSRYWLLIRPGSGIIRRLWLRAAKRRAERSR